jgi:hypothetical protein
MLQNYYLVYAMIFTAPGGRREFGWDLSELDRDINMVPKINQL